MRSRSSKRASLPAPMGAASGTVAGGAAAALPLRPADSAAKRSFDIATALSLLIFFAPLMSLIAVVVWCSGDGILSAEDHVGVDGRIFRRWQFRLCTGPIGRLLRNASLDQLPQLFNVVTGEMSLVGPRALAAAELSRYGVALADYQNCRPGLTGLWQISGCSSRNYLHRVELDRFYARNWSFRTDLAILIQTPGQPLAR